MKQDLEVKYRVKEILKIIQQLSLGNFVELRIQPYAAIQCVTGSVHKRGTPPNVVDMSRQTLIKLINYPGNWDEFCSKGLIIASGTKANLEDLFGKVSKLAPNLRQEM